MNAHEAMELTKGSIKRKGWLFKMRLAWLCGRLNHAIENNAELGRGYAQLNNINRHTALLYFPIMAKLYEADDYFVCYTHYYTYGYNKFVVFWNKNEIPYDVKYNYNYYTGVNKNESNCSSNGN